jgi:hypothetical protein
MVGTILSMVHRERQQRKTTRILWLHSVGYLVGSALMGGMLAVLGKFALGGVPPTVRGFLAFVLPGSIGLLYSAREMGLIKLPTPQCKWQVPHQWCYLLPEKLTSFLYGIGLGFALLTRIPVSSFYAAALWVVLVGEPLLGMICMALFGIGRALSLILLAPQRGADPMPLYVNGMVLRWKPVMHLVNGLTLGSIGAGLLVAGLMLYV